MARGFGFIIEDVDLSSRRKVYPISDDMLFVFPLSAYDSISEGRKEPASDEAVFESYDGTSVSGRFLFSRYRSSGYVDLGKDPGFDSDFTAAKMSFRCVVQQDGTATDLWLFFDTDDVVELFVMDSHVPKAWIVTRDEDVDFHEVDVTISESDRIMAFEDGKTAYRYVYAMSPQNGSTGLSCCLSMEEVIVPEEESDNVREQDKKLVNLGVLQDGTRGVTKTGGTPAKEGFIPQLGPDGIIDESMLPASYGDWSKELRRHINDKNNPHEVTKAQVGLGNADNTSDLDKPVSTATSRAIRAAFDDLRNEINEKFENIEYIDGPLPNTAYGLLERQNKLVSNMNGLVGLISNT